MNVKIKKSLVAGIVGTAIMTAVIMLAPMMGIPKMSPPQMLSETLGTPIAVSWILHFMIGIVFAFGYTYICIFKYKIANVWLKGVVYGIIVFAFVQIMMKIMGMMVPIPKMGGSMLLVAVGSLMGHIIFGMAVSNTVGKTYCAIKACKTK